MYEVNWALIVGPAVVAALVAGLVSFLTSERRLKTDVNLAERRFEFDKNLAGHKIKLDQALADWKRKTELAEVVLADFYKAQSIFDNARTPFSFQGEGQTRPREGDETQAIASMRDTYYAPIERLNVEREFLSDLRAKRFRFMALFGSAAGEHFLVFVRSYNRVATATNMLLAHNSDGYEAEFRRKLEGVIGWTTDEEKDEIRQQINGAIKAIEDICRPVIDSKP